MRAAQITGLPPTLMIIQDHSKGLVLGFPDCSLDGITTYLENPLKNYHNLGKINRAESYATSMDLGISET